VYCHISITTIGDPERSHLYAEQCSSLFAERMGVFIGFLHHIGCRPLSRQDLVSWKLALDRHELAGVDKEALQKVSGFVDVDQIHKDAWPALMADLTAEGPSIIASAFGMIHFMCPCSHANMPGENRAVQFVQKSLQTGLFIFRVYTPEIAILWTDN
jgi:hypothetical protein